MFVELEKPIPRIIISLLICVNRVVDVRGIDDLQLIHAKQALTPSGWQFDVQVTIVPTGRIGSVGPVSRASVHTGWKRPVRHRAYYMDRYGTDHHDACRGGPGAINAPPRPDVQT